MLNVAGANVTTPYKEAMIPYLDELSEGATIIGSINTIVRKGNKLKGYNTNAIGFMDALKDAGLDARRQISPCFGTGGAARAVVFILNWVHAKSDSCHRPKSGEDPRNRQSDRRRGHINEHAYGSNPFGQSCGQCDFGIQS